MRPELKAAFAKASAAAAAAAAATATNASKLPPGMPFTYVGGELRPIVRLHRSVPAWHLYAVTPDPDEPWEHLSGVKIAEPFATCSEAIEAGNLAARNLPQFVREQCRGNPLATAAALAAIRNATFIVVNNSLGQEATRWPVLAVVCGEPQAARSWWKRMLGWLW